MPGINLYQPEQVETQQKSFSEKTMLLSLGILLLVLGLFGGFRLYNMYFYDQKISETDQKITEVSKGLDSDQAVKVYDFAMRNETMSADLGVKEKKATEYFATLQKAMIPEAQITEFTLDKKGGSLTIKGKAASLDIVSRQIRSLKMQPEFVSATVKGLGIESKTTDGSTFQTFELSVPIIQ